MCSLFSFVSITFLSEVRNQILLQLWRKNWVRKETRICEERSGEIEYEQSHAGRRWGRLSEQWGKERWKPATAVNWVASYSHRWPWWWRWNRCSSRLFQWKQIEQCYNEEGHGTEWIVNWYFDVHAAFHEELNDVSIVEHWVELTVLLRYSCWLIDACQVRFPISWARSVPVTCWNKWLTQVMISSS